MYRDELYMVKTKKNEFNEELPDSADENEIKRLSEEFYKVCNLNVPQEYIEFLSLLNCNLS